MKQAKLLKQHQNDNWLDIIQNFSDSFGRYRNHEYLDDHFNYGTSTWWISPIRAVKPNVESKQKRSTYTHMSIEDNNIYRTIINTETDEIISKEMIEIDDIEKVDKCLCERITDLVNKMRYEH